MLYQFAVALLPGFLGFEKIGEFYCFADRVERLHLVGHSTGGVDAALLTGARSP